jgi:hypothetical protein
MTVLLKVCENILIVVSGTDWRDREKRQKLSIRTALFRTRMMNYLKFAVLQIINMPATLWF